MARLEANCLLNAPLFLWEKNSLNIIQNRAAKCDWSFQNLNSGVESRISKFSPFLYNSIPFKSFLSSNWHHIFLRIHLQDLHLLLALYSYEVKLPYSFTKETKTLGKRTIEKSTWSLAPQFILKTCKRDLFVISIILGKSSTKMKHRVIIYIYARHKQRRRMQTTHRILRSSSAAFNLIPLP